MNSALLLSALLAAAGDANSREDIAIRGRAACGDAPATDSAMDKRGLGEVLTKQWLVEHAGHDQS